MRYFLFFLCTFTLTNCATSHWHERHVARKIQRDIKRSPVFEKAFTGFVLLDPVTGERLCDVQGAKYFTPASNTKILTLYTCLRVLGDSMPAMRYRQTDSISIAIRPTGDPTLLHPLFQAWQQPFQFLKNNPAALVDYMVPEEPITPLGKGWAWDDAAYDYSAERSACPVYGNVRRIFAAGPDSLNVTPAYWHPYLTKSAGTTAGDVVIAADNRLQYGPNMEIDSIYEREIPVFDAATVNTALLADALEKLMFILHRPDTLQQWHTLYSAPIDTVLRRMMYESDNFVAEQMLLVCGGVQFHTLSGDSIIRWMQNGLFKNLPQPVKWVDGSGLSRYNLNTPQNNAEILRRLWTEQPHPRVLSLFPAGGVSGTLKDWYAGPDGRPFVWAKTGTMGGVHCLSGYVRTRHGKMLVFSFMHNNFTGSSKPWKAEMQRLLWKLWAL